MERSRTILNSDKQIRALRELREQKCFSVINRGKLWYDTLDSAQRAELRSWYYKWLNVTETLVIPEDLPWINNKIIDEEIY